MPSLHELAERCEGKIVGAQDVEISRVSSHEDAQAGSLTFATDQRYFQLALDSAASAVLVEEKLLDPAVQYHKPLLVVAHARIALSQILSYFERKPPRGRFRHPSAVIEPSATLGENVHVGAMVYVGERAQIGDGTTLQTGAMIAADARVGADCLLYQQSRVLEGCVLGDRVVLHPGATVGSEGFGWAFDEGRLKKIPQVGNVILDDDVEIGSNTCVDRAQTGSTRIGMGTKIDNLCQIGHNCRIGKHTALAAQNGLAGSTIIGDYTQIGGQAGFRGHITIGSRVTIAAGSAVWGNIPDDAFVSGRPARPHKEELRREVMVRKLPKLFDRVDALEGKRKPPPSE